MRRLARGTLTPLLGLAFALGGGWAPGHLAPAQAADSGDGTGGTGQG